MGVTDLSKPDHFAVIERHGNCHSWPTRQVRRTHAHAAQQSVHRDGPSRSPPGNHASSACKGRQRRSPQNLTGNDLAARPATVSTQQTSHSCRLCYFRSFSHESAIVEHRSPGADKYGTRSVPIASERPTALLMSLCVRSQSSDRYPRHQHV